MDDTRQSFTIQLFLDRPGDLGIEDIPVSGAAGLESAKRVAVDHLSGHFGDRDRRHNQKPHRARLLGTNGSVVAFFEMGYAGVREMPNA